MDGSPHLLTDVKFTERRRGYDPEEVDNFLERVSEAVAQLQDKLREATARAEEADARLAEAQRAQATAEAQRARAGGEDVVVPGSTAERVDPEVEAERASKILLMAQKTADATIEDANETAQQTIADARAKAATLVRDAESEADKILGEARREAEELVERQRAAVVKDVKELEEVRTQVQGDVDALRSHLEEQRARIRRGVEALALVLDDPDSLRMDDQPELSGRSLDDVVDESDESDASTLEGRDEGTVDVTDETKDAGGEPVSSPSGDEVVVLDGVDASGVDLTAAPQPTREPGGIFSSNSLAPPSPAGVDAPQTTGEPAKEFPPVSAPEAKEDDGPDIDLAGDDLFGSDRDERGGPPTQQFAPFADADDPLGPPDDEADRAMRAFFEADFDAQAPEQRSRFGFRR